MEIITAQQNKEKENEKNWEQFQRPLYNMKHSNIRIIGISEEEQKKKGPEKIFEEIIVEKIP